MPNTIARDAAWPILTIPTDLATSIEARAATLGWEPARLAIAILRGERKPRLLFSTKSVEITEAAAALLREGGVTCADVLDRHLSGDWGTDETESPGSNEAILGAGVGRPFSRFLVGLDPDVAVVVETDLVIGLTRIETGVEYVVHTLPA